MSVLDKFLDIMRLNPEDEEDDLPDGIEGQLTELSDADLEDQ